MAFEWKNNQNGVDDVLAEDINDIAREVLRLGGNTYTKEEVDALLANIDLSNYYTKGEIDTLVGDIDTVLDGIIAIQNELIGGESE